MRFLHPLNELTAETAERLAQPDPAREFALVLAENLPPGEALIGAVARCSIVPETREAEFALFVARPVRGQGLGAYLLRKLLDWARRKRLTAIYGDVLQQNEAMLTLAERMGFVRAHVIGDHGTMRVIKQLERPKLRKTRRKVDSKRKTKPKPRGSARRPR